MGSGHSSDPTCLLDSWSFVATVPHQAVATPFHPCLASSPKRAGAYAGPSSAGLFHLTVSTPTSDQEPGSRARRTTAPRSVVIEFTQAVIVDAGVVAKLVDDGDAHLLLKVCGIGEVRLQR